MKPGKYSERLIIAAEQKTKERDFWVKQLSGELQRTTFPYDFKYNGQDAKHAAHLAKALELNQDKDRELFSRLAAVSKESDYTLNLILLTCLTLLLNKYTGSKDILLGTPIYKQETEGEFINTILVLRNQIQNNITFKEFLLEVKQTITNAVENQNYPIEILEEELNLEIVEQGSSLFDVVVLLENIHKKEYIRHIRSNMIFSFEKNERSINGVVEYNSSLYKKTTIDKIVGHFRNLLQHALFNLDLPLSHLDMFSREEKEQVLVEFNQTQKEYPGEKTVHRMFAEQAERTPGNIAVSYPMDLSNIYDLLESSSPITGPGMEETLGNCCFRKNSYIYRVSLDLPAQKGKANLWILKTHRHNSIIANQDTAALIELFDGHRNLTSIYTTLLEFKRLKNINLSFLIYSMRETDLLEVTFQFNDEPQVYSINGNGFEEFAKLVKVLYKNHLIQLVGVQAGEVVFEVAPDAGFYLLPGDRLSLPIERALFKTKELTNARVLLLGDTPGTASTGILYLAAYLTREGIKSYCQSYDPSRDHKSMTKNIEELLDAVQPEVVAISMKWFLYIARVIDICKIVKAYSRENHRDIKVVVGGNTASYYWEEIINYDCIDILVRGDGEEPLLQICQGKDIAKIPNCVYKKNGQIVENPITYIQEENGSPGIYLSHLEEIMLSNYAARFGTFFIYTHKGCAMNCLYCGGCSQAQQKTFNRGKVLRRGIEEVRKDILTAQTYASTFHFEFDIPDTGENLLDYCNKIWADIDLSGHFCVFSTLTPPTAALIELVSQTFKYVYWDLDICTPSERHRQELASMRLVKPQLTDKQILDFMAQCEKYSNIEVRPNLITGLPYFTLEDIEPGEALLAKIMVYSCFGELHWARLHAQPGAPIVETADTRHMHSLASTFADFMHYSEENFNTTSGYSTVETFNYPYIYFNDDRLNSGVTNFYLETNRKVDQTIIDRNKSLFPCNTLTYRQLNEAAGQLCDALRDKGIEPGQIIGLMLERSIDIPVGILGIMKAGCAYMPIDPEFPRGRVEFMLKDCHTAALVTTQTQSGPHLSYLSNTSYTCPIINLENLRDRQNLTSEGHHFNFPASLPSSPAYLIYTSGTTGKPKGVVLTHDNLVNYVHWFSTTVNLTREDKTILTSSFAFDLGYTSLYPSILKGGQLHILPREMYLLAQRLLDYIKQQGITYLKVTPSLFSIIANSPHFSAETCKNLRFAAIGGEAINVEDIEKAHSICPHLRIMNHYGPTEATIGCVAALIDFDQFETYKQTPVIGKPIYNTRVYIFNKSREILPPGVPGELSISGTCLARGYLNRPELTAEKFDHDLWDYHDYHDEKKANLQKQLSGQHQTKLNKKFLRGGPGGAVFSKSAPPGRRRQNIYRTGDLARWLPNGTIEFLGRIDTQVKIRGYRIELGEIENRLKKHQQIEDALVMVRELSTPGKNSNDEPGDKYLCAYVVPKKDILQPTENTKHDPGSLENPEILTLKQLEHDYLGFEAGTPHRSLLDLFEQQVKKNHDKIAVKSNGDSYTYQSLNHLTNRAAHKILEEYDDRYKLSKSERVRYKRQMLLHGWGLASQEKLKRTTVFVAGAGGGASPTLMQLALAGFGTIIICDCDVVELSNLNRQFLHDETRIGMNKALSAKMTLEKINLHVNVIPITERLTSENVFELVGDAEMILDMFDGQQDKFILSWCAAVKGIPHIISAMTDINAYAAIFHPPKTPCFHCIFDKKKLEEIISGMSHIMNKYEKNPLPVVATSLFMSTGFAVNEAIKISLGLGTPAYNKFIFFNQRGSGELAFTESYRAMTYTFSEHFRQLSRHQGFDWDIGWRGNFLEELEIKPDPQCILCGKDSYNNININVKKTGIKPGKSRQAREHDQQQAQTVTLLLDHNREMAVGIIAALKSAKTYVTMEPDAPTESLNHILEDSESRLILTNNDHLELAVKIRDKVNKNIKILNLDLLKEPDEGGEPHVKDEEKQSQNFNIEMNPLQMVYISYSPGSQPRWQKDFWKTLLNGSEAYVFKNPGKPVPWLSLSRELREYLLEQLPDYMLPSHFIQLDKIPLTPNGKVDRKSLPEPGTTEEEEDFVTPRNPLEEKIAAIWSEVLQIDKNRLGINANFFQLGGHSLKATILASKIHKELNVKIPMEVIFKTPQIKNLSAYIQEMGMTEDKYISIKPVESKEYYWLSSAQKRMYSLHRLDETSTRYNMDSVMILAGPIHKNKVEDTFKKLIQRHESLRSSFDMIENQPVQRVHEPDSIDFAVVYYDAEGRGEVDTIVKNFLKGFDLSHAPLLKVGIIKITGEKHVLMVDMPHIISDGTSVDILEQEFRVLYTGEELPKLRLQYKDYAQWQKSLYQSAAIKKQEQYWLDRFKGPIPVLNLPLDYPRPSIYTAKGSRIMFEIDKEMTTGIRQLLTETETTLYMVLLAAYVVLLSKYSGQEDIIVGSPVASRRHSDLENIIGLFINMLAMRNQPKKEKTFRDFLEEVKVNALDAYENQEYQFEDLVRKLNLKVAYSRSPLFDVVFVVQNTAVGEMDVKEPGELSKMRVLPYEVELEYVHNELLLNAQERFNTLFMTLEYSTELFKKSTVQKIAAHYREILNQILKDEYVKLGDIKISHDYIAAKPGTIQDDQGDFRL